MFRYERREELVVCEMCNGEMIVMDECGEGVCMFCDGMGVVYAPITTLLEADPRSSMEDGNN